MTPRYDYVDYLSFRWLISPTVIRAVYILGALAITGWGIFTILGAFSARTYLGGNGILWLGLLWGAAILGPGHLLWRLLCEFCIVVFQIAEEISELRSAMPEAVRGLTKSLDAMTRNFQEGVRELSAIKEELREGVSHTKLQETLASLVTQFERGTSRFAAVAEALQELSRSELPEALKTAAERFQEGAERFARLEDQLPGHLYGSPAVAASGRTAPLDTVGTKGTEASAGRVHHSPPRSRKGARVLRRVLKGALVVLGVVLLGAGVFVALPLASGSVELHNVDLKSLGNLFSNCWDYWLGIVQEKELQGGTP